MRYILVICCVLASVLAREKKISLDDIERDNVNSEKSVRTAEVKSPNGSPTDYGFVPVKTVADYARQEPKQYYTPPPQQYQAVPQQYYYPQHNTQPNPYQQYQNVHYITDNSIAQTPQYYTPQYVYLQQYTAPSTAIQTIVDPKGRVQYIMYLPASYVQKAEQTQNYENIVYANADTPQTQYVAQEEQKYIAAPQVSLPGIQYAPQVQSSKFVSSKQEPKSLLDSYIPSILQYQYYKQQQAQANAIQQSRKEIAVPAIGKIEYAKNYRPVQTQHSSAESSENYKYRVPANYQQ